MLSIQTCSSQATRAVLFVVAFLFASVSTVTLAQDSLQGRVGVGTWRTQAEFKDIVVTRGDEVLYDSRVTPGLEGWETMRGRWSTEGGVIRQLGDEERVLALVGDASWSDYTLSLKARKLGGAEGFLIVFGSPSAATKSWWNIGGWGNTQHAIETPGLSTPRVPGQIEVGRWYDIRVELRGNTVKAYLDGELVHEGKRTPPEGDFGRALVPDLVADPSVSEFDGTFYLYMTTDGMGQGLSTAGLPVVWTSKDFEHWRFEGSIFPENYDAKYWAPSRVIKKDGRYYLFPTLNNRITAVVSDSPEGPFRTLDGRDIYPGSGWEPFPIEVGHPIDASIFRDDDGSTYMTWSQRYIAKMRADFTGFEGEPVAIRTKRGGYSEGPYIIKRNGIYYYLYTLGGSEGYRYAYMMSRESVMGPWTAPERDIISRTDHEVGVYGPGHGCFFNPEGTDDWYFVYLEYGRWGTNRHVQVNRMTFNEDGTIEPISLTKSGVGSLRFDPKYAMPDLARGKETTASSVRGPLWISPINDARLNRLETFEAGKAVDGSNGSRWMAAEGDESPWFVLDLGRVTAIERTELCFVTPTKGHAYRLESSVDGEHWEVYGGQSDVQIRSPHVDERSARVRYLRVTIESGAPGLWAFRVY